nr:MAG TPA: hypothetical protein [Caudoviricetes sp.]
MARPDLAGPGTRQGRIRHLDDQPAGPGHPEPDSAQDRRRQPR